MARPAELQEPELSLAMQRVVAAMAISIAVHLALIGMVRINAGVAPVAADLPVIQVRLQPLVAPPAPAPPIAAPVIEPEAPAPKVAPEAPPKPVHPAPAASVSPPAQSELVSPTTVSSDIPASANPAPQTNSALPAVNMPLLVDPTYYTAKQLDVQPRPLVSINPAYPPDAIARGTTGWVALKLKLDERGNVQDVEFSDASPPGIFNQSALDAFSHAHFAAAQKDGRAVKSLIQIKVRYELD
jgi:protein TonB